MKSFRQRKYHLAAGFGLAASILPLELAAQFPAPAAIPSGQYPSPQPSLITPGYQMTSPQGQLISPQGNTLPTSPQFQSVPSPQYQYSPTVPPPLMQPALPSPIQQTLPATSMPQTRGHRIGIWTETEYDQPVQHNYVSQRYSGFNDNDPLGCWAVEPDCTNFGFGDSVYSAFNQQITNGIASLLTLYHFDFFPHGSERETEVTHRGLYQLQKIVNRHRSSGGLIKIQASGDPVLDGGRRESVIRLLTDYGISEKRVVLYHPRPARSAMEADVLGRNTLNSTQLRGRTIQGDGDSSFSGSTTFGQ